MSKKSVYLNGLVEIDNSPYSSASTELRNQYYSTLGVPKKDKRKLAITNRLISMEEAFHEDKNEHYRTSLAQLQQGLFTTHNETNDTFLEKVKNSQERRDYELTRLRLWESYQVNRVERETREDVEKINEEYDTFIKIIKDKLYEKLVRKIKLLKEDKVLKDLANVNHYSIDVDLMSTSNGNTTNATANGNRNGNGRANELAALHESPKKRLVSDREAASGLLSGFSDTNNSSAPLGRRSARRTRNAVESSYNTDSNLSGNDSNMPGYGSSSNKRRRFQSARAAASSINTGQHNTRSYSSASNDEANFFSDNNSLSEILFGKNYSSSGGNRSSYGQHSHHQGAASGGAGGNGSSKSASRAKAKQFPSELGLDAKEITEDMMIFESCLEKAGQTPVPFPIEPVQNSNGKKSGR